MVVATLPQLHSSRAHSLRVRSSAEEKTWKAFEVARWPGDSTCAFSPVDPDGRGRTETVRLSNGALPVRQNERRTVVFSGVGSNTIANVFCFMEKLAKTGQLKACPLACDMSDVKRNTKKEGMENE